MGRRLLGGEVADEFDHYVDLTAEFEEPSFVRMKDGYRSLPILDASIPSISELEMAIEVTSKGRTYVHCAQGHGRTGLFALAFLIRRGRVDSVKEGLALLRERRPAIRLNRKQMEFIAQFAEHEKEEGMANVNTGPSESE